MNAKKSAINVSVYSAFAPTVRGRIIARVNRWPSGHGYLVKYTSGAQRGFIAIVPTGDLFDTSTRSDKLGNRTLRGANWLALCDTLPIIDQGVTPQDKVYYSTREHGIINPVAMYKARGHY